MYITLIWLLFYHWVFLGSNFQHLWFMSWLTERVSVFVCKAYMLVTGSCADTWAAAISGWITLCWSRAPLWLVNKLICSVCMWVCKWVNALCGRVCECKYLYVIRCLRFRVGSLTDDRDKVQHSRLCITSSNSRGGFSLYERKKKRTDEHRGGVPEGLITAANWIRRKNVFTQLISAKRGRICVY